MNTETGPRTNIRILLVDDDSSLRAVVRDILELSGYRVLEAEDGLRALEITRSSSSPIHLLLTDMIMPGMTGSELARRVLASNPDTKILFMSGYTEYSLEDSRIRERVKAFIWKPFSKDALLDKVREVLQDSDSTP